MGTAVHAAKRTTAAHYAAEVSPSEIVLHYETLVQLARLNSLRYFAQSAVHWSWSLPPSYPAGTIFAFPSDGDKSKRDIFLLTGCARLCNRACESLEEYQGGFVGAALAVPTGYRTSYERGLLTGMGTCCGLLAVIFFGGSSWSHAPITKVCPPLLLAAAKNTSTVLIFFLGDWFVFRDPHEGVGMLVTRSLLALMIVALAHVFGSTPGVAEDNLYRELQRYYDQMSGAAIRIQSVIRGQQSRLNMF